MGSGTLVRGLVLAAIFSTTGCSLHYYDKETGTEHLWGFGHLKMRAVPQQGDQAPFTNAVIAYVTGVRTVGVNMAAGSDYTGVGAGWDSRARMMIRSDGAQFYLLWPTNSIRLPQDLKDLFTVRVGPDFLPTNSAFGHAPTVSTNPPTTPNQ